MFVQQVLGYSPLAAGSSTIPIAVVSLAVSALLAPRVIGRIGAARTLAAGLAIQGAGLLLLRSAGADAGYLANLFPAYCLVGFGLGFAQVAVQIAAFVGIEGHEAGIAGGALVAATMLRRTETAASGAKRRSAPPSGREPWPPRPRGLSAVLP